MADKTDAAVSNNDAAKDDAKVDTPVAEAASSTPVTPAADTASTSDAKNTDADTGDKKDGDKTPAAAPAPTIEQSLEEGIGNVVKGFGSIWGVMKARVSERCAATQGRCDESLFRKVEAGYRPCPSSREATAATTVAPS